MPVDAKKKGGGLGSMKLGRKTTLKKSIIDIDKVEKIVKEVHEEKKEPTSKASVILPRSEYKAMKKALLEKDISISF